MEVWGGLRETAFYSDFLKILKMKNFKVTLIYAFLAMRRWVLE